MTDLNASQSLMLFGLLIAFASYFALTWHKHQKGREMILSKDKRLYPTNYHELTKSDRKRLYRIHTWKEAWDGMGKVYAIFAAIGVFMFVLSVLL